MKLLKLGLLLALFIGTLTVTRRPSAQQPGPCTLACINANTNCRQNDALQEALSQDNASINEGYCESAWSGFRDDCYSINNYTAAGIDYCDFEYSNLIVQCLIQEQAADEQCQNQQDTADAACDYTLGDCEARCPPGG